MTAADLSSAHIRWFFGPDYRNPLWSRMPEFLPLHAGRRPQLAIGTG
jgi:hypothetical protein